jgi:fatty acid desaturase
MLSFIKKIINFFKFKNLNNSKNYKQKDELWLINGKYYDLTTFIHRHPGGNHSILLGKGIDCSILFEQYHILNDNHKKILKLFEVYYYNEKDIQDNNDSNEIEDGENFYEDIRKMVQEYVLKNGKNSHKMKSSMLYLLLFVFVSTIFSWYLWFKEYWISLILLPIFNWLLTVNTFHDGTHFSVSKNPLINKICAWTCVPLFFNSITWYIQHIVSHHCYTNHVDKDCDVDFLPFLRNHHEQDKLKQNKIYNIITLFLVSSLTTFVLSVIHPLLSIFDKCHNTVSNRNNIIKTFSFQFISQLLITLSYYIYPFVSGFNYPIIFILVPQIIGSLIFFFISQISHINQNSQLYSTNELSNMHWSKNMIYTSVDYCTDSFIYTFITGGLNMQSLHHLIPSVSSTRYQELYPRFRKICKKYNYKINEYDSIFEPLNNYLNYVLYLSEEK